MVYRRMFMKKNTQSFDTHSVPKPKTMVDLSLATSYVPAIICLIKSFILVTLSHFLLPHGGLVFGCVLLLLDRSFLNSDTITDINAIIASLFFLQVSNHERTHNSFVRSYMPLYAASAAWTGLTLHQLAVKSLRHKTELLCHSLLIVIISTTQFLQESYLQTMLRGLAYSTSVLLLIYFHISQSVEEKLLFKLLRFCPIALTPTPVACILFCSSVCIIVFNWKPIQFSPPSSDVDVEAAALREALAALKDKGGN